MHTYTFHNRDLLNSSILDSSMQPHFITKTSWGFLQRRSTVLTDISGNVLAKIHWRNKAFEIHGIVISTNLIKSKKADPLFSLKRNWQRYWQWSPSSPRYSIKYGDQQWTATDFSNNSTQAIFTPYKRRIFRKSKLATLTTQKALPQTEALFLLLAMLRMEIRRLESEASAEQQRQTSVQTNVTTIAMSQC